MKAIIIADVHSNIAAIEAIWRHEQGADAVYCAGDLVDMGPCPNEVIAWMMERKATCISGNHDTLLLQMYDEQRDNLREKQEGLTWAEHNTRRLTPTSVDFLRRLPEMASFSLDGHEYCLRHAYRGYETVPSKYQFTHFMRSCRVPDHARLILGHTHRQCVLRFSEHQVSINPGSTAYRSYQEPDDPNTEAEYAVVQDGQVQLCSVDYDKAALRRLVAPLKDQILAKDHAKMMLRLSDSRRI